MNEWTHRTRMLLGEEKSDILADSAVAVVGLGGVGAYAAELICRSGVGRMILADGDRVEKTNKNRQLLALDSTLGKFKTEVMSERCRDINPEIRIETVSDFLKDDLLRDFFERYSFDYVVDAIDTLAPKVFLIYECVKRGIPLVSLMGSGGKYAPEQVRIGDISDSFNCALARMVRKRLHRLGIYEGVKVVFSTESTDENSVVNAEEIHKRSNVGTISYMPSVFGCFAASVVIRDLISGVKI